MVWQGRTSAPQLFASRPKGDTKTFPKLVSPTPKDWQLSRKTIVRNNNKHEMITPLASHSMIRGQLNCLCRDEYRALIKEPESFAQFLISSEKPIQETLINCTVLYCSIFSSKRQCSFFFICDSV